MQTNNRLLDDLAKVANGAVSTLVGVKSEVEASIRQQLERLLVDMDLVTRDEFEAIREVAVTARAEQERLQTRIAALEATLANQAKPNARTRASKPKAKPAAAKPAKK
ncbi:MAG: accessory factor UbiK family protein [Rhodospirillales bacterium]|nr:accessory factor UbiK family protein [Rhodospirillales bacterium]